MKTIFSLFETSKRRYFKAIMVLIMLTNLLAVSSPFSAEAAGSNCVASSPLGGAYTVTPCFTIPVDGATVSGNQTVSVTVTLSGPNTGISKLIFYLNGQYLITDFQSPYTFVLPTNKWMDGSEALSVAVTMKDGFISQSSSITLTFNNGITTPPVNNSAFTPTSGTTPQVGQPFVLAAAGDGADGAKYAGKVTGLIASWNPNLFLYLGDVYEQGTFTEFYNWYGNSGVFFGQFRSITDPIVGNHEYLSGAAASGYFDYWDNVPSYYSYDAGGWHFIALNSNCGLAKICLVGQTEYQWLQNDLNTHNNACTIAYYHHPVFNVGPEGSSTAMKDMWALMAQHGVDIVLNGHDHDYQRWVPLDGNGVPSSTGITEFVAGGGGHGTQQSIVTDNRMAIGFSASPDAFGALRLQLNQYGANFQYVNYLGIVLDSGSIPCSGASSDTTTPTSPASPITTDNTAPSIPTNLTANVSSTNVKLSWTTSTDNVGVANYDIYRNGALLTSIGPVTSFTDLNLTPGATYTYQVKTRDSSGNVSGFSNTVTAAIPTPLFSAGFEGLGLLGIVVIVSMVVLFRPSGKKNNKGAA